MARSTYSREHYQKGAKRETRTETSIRRAVRLARYALYDPPLATSDVLPKPKLGRSCRVTKEGVVLYAAHVERARTAAGKPTTKIVVTVGQEYER